MARRSTSQLELPLQPLWRSATGWPYWVGLTRYGYGGICWAFCEMKRNIGKALVKVCEWTVMGIVITVMAWLLFTDSFYQWRAQRFEPVSEIVGVYTPAVHAEIQSVPLLERPRTNPERERCMDIIDIATDKDIAAKSEDYARGWNAARSIMLQHLRNAP